MKKFASMIAACVAAPLLVLPTAPGVHAAPQSSLIWGPCPAGSAVAERAQCATFSVPKDYSHPEAGTIDLTMSRLAATGVRKGVIAGNPGGPGGDALGMFADSSPSSKNLGKIQLPDDVRSSYDLIAVEPRGLTFGTPLDCLPNPDEQSVATTIYELCNEKQPGYVGTITTDNTARDLNEARKALGEDVLNLYGVSYGGALMATYATMFPEHTGRMLLDSSVAPHDRWFQLGASRTAIRREVIGAFFSYVAHNDPHYHLGTTPLQVYHNFARVITATFGVTPPATPPAAERGDVPATSIALPPEVLDAAAQLLTKVNYVQWRAAVTGDKLASYQDIDKTVAISTANSPLVAAMYSQEAWPELATEISQSAATNPATPIKQLDTDEILQQTGGDEKTLQQMALTMRFVDQAIVCNENASPADPPRGDAFVLTALFGGDLLTANEDMLASGQYCNGWPVASPARPLSGETLATPPLSLGFKKDTAVGPAGAPSMRDAMGGELVSFDGYSHGVLLTQADKAAPKVSEYFR